MQQRLAQLGAQARDADEQVKLLRQQRNEAIVEAIEMGWKCGEVSKASGLSPSRIIRILAGE